MTVADLVGALLVGQSWPCPPELVVGLVGIARLELRLASVVLTPHSELRARRGLERTDYVHDDSPLRSTP